jgi:hypothetical protein
MQNAHAVAHIVNMLSLSAFAYQGIVFIHLPRPPLRALGCAPAAMVIEEQTSNDQVFTADLA